VVTAVVVTQTSVFKKQKSKTEKPSGIQEFRSVISTYGPTTRERIRRGSDLCLCQYWKANSRFDRKSQGRTWYLVTWGRVSVVAGSCQSGGWSKSQHSIFGKPYAFFRKISRNFFFFSQKSNTEKPSGIQGRFFQLATHNSGLKSQTWTGPRPIV
jgi:hypothetical protein